jgi:hypothetical protein
MDGVRDRVASVIISVIIMLPLVQMQLPLGWHCPPFTQGLATLQIWGPSAHCTPEKPAGHLNRTEPLMRARLNMHHTKICLA